jgi:hypothetical protein
VIVVAFSDRRDRLKFDGPDSFAAWYHAHRPAVPFTIARWGEGDAGCVVASEQLDIAAARLAHPSTPAS